MTQRSRPTDGFTLVEMLVSMAILGVLTLAFTQIFGGTLQASSQINSRNELISEGQIAQQIIAARLQGATYVYPTGTTLRLGSGVTTINSVRSGAGQNWVVGTDPIVAMVLPPTDIGTCSAGSPNACFTFYAYYPYQRGAYLGSSLSNISKPTPDAANNNQWLLLEYRRNIIDGVTRPTLTTVPPVSPATRANMVNWFNTIVANTANPTVRSGSGTLLTDYVQPSNVAPTYTMFAVDTTSSLFNVTVNLRFLRMQGGRALRIPGNTTSTSLGTRVYPRNWY
jgi:prepilin-type N-terminal cleavage/methylation domain-containing protein